MLTRMCVPSCSYNHIPYNILKLPPKFILCPHCLPSVGFSPKNCTESVQDSCPLLKNSLAGAQTKGPLKPYRCFCCKRVLLLMMCGNFEFLILSDRCSIRVMINETTVCCHNRSPSRNRKNAWCVQRDSSTEVHATSAKLHQAQQQLEHESNCANCGTKDTKVSSLASLARCIVLCNATHRVKCFTRFTSQTAWYPYLGIGDWPAYHLSKNLEIILEVHGMKCSSEHIPVISEHWRKLEWGYEDIHTSPMIVTFSKLIYSPIEKV